MKNAYFLGKENNDFKVRENKTVRHLKLESCMIRAFLFLFIEVAEIHYNLKKEQMHLNKNRCFLHKRNTCTNSEDL